MGCCMSSRSPPSRTKKTTVNGTRKMDSGKSKNQRKNQGTGEEDMGVGVYEMSEEELHRIPGRRFLNGSSEKASLFTQQGMKGTNQDAMLVWEDFASREDTIFCGVFDGHGPYGHLVSRKVRDALPVKLCNKWKTMAGSSVALQNGSLDWSTNSQEKGSVSLGKDWTESPCTSNNNNDLPEIYFTLKQSLLKAFDSMDKELKLHSTIDSFCSGTTAVTLIMQGQDLVIGNVGDSRAVLGTRDEDDSLISVQLTVDLKPNIPKEAARIQQCKGRVFAMQDEPDVARVWLPNSDSPGLAMARAFGDFCLKDYGLISVPDVTYWHLTDRDEFVVLASDGVWDVLTNKEVVDIVSSAPTHATAARALVESAVRAWRLVFPASKIDDCAVVCLFFKQPSSSEDKDETNFHERPNGPSGSTSLSVKTDQMASNAEELHLSVPNYTQPLCICSDLVEIVPLCPEVESKDDNLPRRSQSARSIADCLKNTEEEEWSALEGISRVNSLLNLPRFLAGGKKGSSTSQRKWL